MESSGVAADSARKILSAWWFISAPQCGHFIFSREGILVS